MRLISSCLFIVKVNVRRGGFWDSLSCYLSVTSLLTKSFFLCSVLSYRHRTEAAQRCFQENLWPLLLYDPAVLHQGSSRWWGPSQSCWGELWTCCFPGKPNAVDNGSWMVHTQMVMELIELLPIFYATSRCTFSAWKWYSRLGSWNQHVLSWATAPNPINTWWMTLK